MKSSSDGVSTPQAGDDQGNRLPVGSSPPYTNATANVNAEVNNSVFAPEPPCAAARHNNRRGSSSHIHSRDESKIGRTRTPSPQYTKEDAFNDSRRARRTPPCPLSDEGHESLSATSVTEDIQKKTITLQQRSIQKSTETLLNISFRAKAPPDPLLTPVHAEAAGPSASVATPQLPKKKRTRSFQLRLRHKCAPSSFAVDRVRSKPNLVDLDHHGGNYTFAETPAAAGGGGGDGSGDGSGESDDSANRSLKDIQLDEEENEGDSVTSGNENNDLTHLLSKAVQVHGLRLTWILYFTLGLVVVLFVFVIFQQLYLTNQTMQRSGIQAVQAVTAISMNSLEQLRFSFMSAFHMLKLYYPWTAIVDGAVETESLCSRLYGSPIAFAQYNRSGHLSWFVACESGGEATLPPQLSQPAILSESAHIVQYTYDKMAAFVKVMDEGELQYYLGVMVHKEIIGRLLMNVQLPQYSAATLQSVYVGYLFPRWNETGLNISFHSLTAKYSDYVQMQPTSLGRSLVQAHNRWCVGSSEYVWQTVKRNDSLLSYSDATQISVNTNASLNPIPRPHEVREGAWNMLSRMTLCGILCVESVDNRTCFNASQANAMFIVDFDMRNTEGQIALNVIGSISIAAIIVFSAGMLFAFISINTPITFLRSVFLRTVKPRKPYTRCQQRFFKWTHRLWLGDVSALVRAGQIMSFCFLMNQKYVPAHVQRQHVHLFIQNQHRHHIWDAVEAFHVSCSASDKEDDDASLLANDDDGSPELLGTLRSPAVLQHAREGSVLSDSNRILHESSAVMACGNDGSTVAVSVPHELNSNTNRLSINNNSSDAMNHRSDDGNVANCSSAGGTDHGGENHHNGNVHSGEASSSAFFPGKKSNMVIKREEEATILSIRLLNVDNAYMTNYALAARQHRRLMSFLLQRIRHHKGVLFFCSGDALAAAWNAFDSCSNHTEFAAACAVSIWNTLAPFCADGLRVGVVLHQGTFVCGSVEDAKAAFVTAFGDAPRQGIALADLMASQCDLSVVVTEPVKQSLSAIYTFNIVDVVQHSEALHPMLLFELAGRRERTEGATIDFGVDYAKVFYCFRNHAFPEALSRISGMRERYGSKNNHLLRRLEYLCAYYGRHPSLLPNPYARLYPLWKNYEATALAGLSAEKISFVVGERQVFKPFFDAEEVFDDANLNDDGACFKRELYDNVMRLGTPAQQPVDTYKSSPEPNSALPSSRQTEASCSSPILNAHALTVTGNSLQLTREGEPDAAPAFIRAVGTLRSYTRDDYAQDDSPLGAAAANDDASRTGEDDDSTSSRTVENKEHTYAVASPVGGEVTMCEFVDPELDAFADGSESRASERNFSLTHHSRNQHSSNVFNDGAPAPPLALPDPGSFNSDLSGGSDSGGAHPLEAQYSCIQSLKLTIDRHDGNGAASDGHRDFPSKVEAKNGTTYLRSSRVLGKGSFGSVYLGMDAHSGKLVAIKFLPLPSDEEEMEGVEAEVVIMQRVKDPHVVEFISYSFERGTIAIIMECMMAGSLQNMISAFNSIPSSTARVFLRNILRGLHKLHSMGVVHRDVKPQNVLLTLAGNCKISDFGTSAWMQERVRKDATDEQGRVFGTPAYLAPEAARGKSQKKSDVWSCGILFLHLITGKLPYSSTVLSLSAPLFVFQIGSGSAKPIIPDDLDELDNAFVVQCLKEEPSERPSAEQLLQMPLFAL